MSMIEIKGIGFRRAVICHDKEISVEPDARIEYNRKHTPILWIHDSSQPVGRLTDLIEDKAGNIRITALLYPSVMTKTQIELVRSGIVAGLSAGYDVLKGRIHIHEFSLCAMPCVPKCFINSYRYIQHTDTTFDGRAGGSGEEMAQ